MRVRNIYQNNAEKAMSAKQEERHAESICDEVPQALTGKRIELHVPLHTAYMVPACKDGAINDCLY